MKRKMRSFAMMFMSLSLLMTACTKDDPTPPPVNEEELITTVKLKIKETGATTPNVITWKDVDGIGGNPPTIQSIQLSANKTYEVEVEFLDESKNPPLDITEEILEEADDHEVFYQQSNNLVNIIRTDKDSQNLPLGLKATLTTTATGLANLTVILKHKPGTKATGDDVFDGETDIEVAFPLKVE